MLLEAAAQAHHPLLVSCPSVVSALSARELSRLVSKLGHPHLPCFGSFPGGTISRCLSSSSLVPSVTCQSGEDYRAILRYLRLAQLEKGERKKKNVVEMGAFPLTFPSFPGSFELALQRDASFRHSSCWELFNASCRV